ncbi:MAG: hypothetical protein M5U34_25835 [Chloroflexi bacterium]|nr:hypothetical protein [Chloroflexota bacterium]
MHPEQSPALWQALMAAGEPVGLKPCGLAAPGQYAHRSGPAALRS